MPSPNVLARGLIAILLVIFSGGIAVAADPEFRRHKPVVKASPATKAVKKRTKSTTKPRPTPEEPEPAAPEEPEPTPAPEQPAPTPAPEPSPGPSPAAARRTASMEGRWHFSYDGANSGIARIDRQDPDGGFHGTLEAGTRARIDGRLAGETVTLTLRSKTLFVTLATRASGQLVLHGPRARIEGTWKGVRSSGRFAMERVDGP